MALPSQEHSSIYQDTGTKPRVEDIDVTITIKNEIQRPHFNHSITVGGRNGSKLLNFLETAADEDERFQFSAAYFSNMGFMVNTINKLTADGSNPQEGTYWKIISVTHGVPLDVGVSTYEPEDGEEILFEFSEYHYPPGSDDNTCPD